MERYYYYVIEYENQLIYSVKMFKGAFRVSDALKEISSFLNCSPTKVAVTFVQEISKDDAEEINKMLC